MNMNMNMNMKYRKNVFEKSKAWLNRTVEFQNDYIGNFKYRTSFHKYYKHGNSCSFGNS